MLKIGFIFCFAVLFMTACRPKIEEVPPKTTQEMHELQTKIYDVQNVKLVMKSILITLQEEGYVMKNVALDLGFISASKEIELEDGSESFFATVMRGGQARWMKSELTEATITTTAIGPTVRVRAHFQVKKIDNRGVIQAREPISDAAFYEQFFDRVQKCLLTEEHST